MNSIIPPIQGIIALEGSEKELGEMEQKTAALWIKYSYFSVNRHDETNFS